MKKMKIVVILSGGIDSTTMLYKFFNQKKKYKVEAISFNYGQRHKKELKMARKTCQKLKIEHKIINVSFLKKLLSNSALTGKIHIPKGHYENKSMKSTVVPNRNMILASIAIGYAVNENYDAIALGIHSGDHAIYPDCRPNFLKALNEVSKIANYKSIKVLAPYLKASKTDIVKEGKSLGVDYSLTWTCYEGRKKACGKCGSCQERLEAFRDNNLIDPISYEEKK